MMKENERLKARIDELEKGIKIFDNEAYEEHVMSAIRSKCLTKLLRLIDKKKTRED